MSFVSILKTIGHDFKVGLEHILPIAETAGEAAVQIFLPALSPMFNTTVAAVAMAEQNLAAVGKQDGTGPQKLALVLQMLEPVISSGLKDMGKDGSTASVTNYINSVVTILNTIPANAVPKPVPLPAPVITQ